MARRTTHRSSSGKKLYAVRDRSGKFKDIQTHERVSRADQRTTSAKEAVKAGRKKAAKKKGATKKAAKKKAAKKK